MGQRELLVLKRRDVDVEISGLSVWHTITVSEGRILLGEPKTKKSRRTIRLTDAAGRALRRHLARQLEWIEQVGTSTATRASSSRARSGPR